VGSVVIKKEVEVSRLSGAEGVVGQRGKFEFYALFNRKPMNMFKNTRRLCFFVGERDRQRLWPVCFGRAVADLYFLYSTEEKRVGIV